MRTMQRGRRSDQQPWFQGSADNCYNEVIAELKIFFETPHFFSQPFLAFFLFPCLLHHTHVGRLTAVSH